MQHRSWRAGLALLAILALVAASCGGDDTNESASGGDTQTDAGGGRTGGTLVLTAANRLVTFGCAGALSAGAAPGS